LEDGKMKRQAILVSIMVFIVILTSNMYATTVGGIINTDTTWALENSPFIIDGDIQIAYGAKLTIEAGVNIIGGGIYVYGVLEAIGEPNNIIVFDSVWVHGGNNSPSEPFLISLEFCRFNRGSLYAASGNAEYGSLILTDSFLSKMYNEIYLWYPIADCVIERNVFYKTGELDIILSDGIRHRVCSFNCVNGLNDSLRKMLHSANLLLLL
jgi:hypothetical protein